MNCSLIYEGAEIDLGDSGVWHGKSTHSPHPLDIASFFEENSKWVFRFRCFISINDLL